MYSESRARNKDHISFNIKRKASKISFGDRQTRESLQSNQKYLKCFRTGTRMNCTPRTVEQWRYCTTILQLSAIWWCQTLRNRIMLFFWSATTQWPCCQIPFSMFMCILVFMFKCRPIESEMPFKLSGMFMDKTHQRSNPLFPAHLWLHKSIDLIQYCTACKRAIINIHHT